MIETHNIVLDVRDPRVLSTDITMVQNDCKANVLHITMLGVTDWTGVTGQAKYMRSDGKAVVDTISFIDGVADHVVPLAALNVSGVVRCEVTLFKGDIRATSNQIMFVVREDINTDPSLIADTNFPILDGLIKDTVALNNTAKADADRAESYTSHPNIILENKNWGVWNGTAYIDSLKPSTGDQGIQGVKGDTGAQGIQGVKGDTGLTGAKGDTGLTGAQGPATAVKVNGTTYSDTAGVVTLPNLATQVEADAIRSRVVSIDGNLQSFQNTLSQVNINQSPTQAVTGYDPILSLPKNAANGNAGFGLKGQTLKNELNYNNVTWAEWTKSPGVVGGVGGLEFSANGSMYTKATLATKLKGSTKYALLLVSKNNNLTTGLSLENYVIPASVSFLNAGVTGNAKFVFTTNATIAQNIVSLFIGAGTTGTKITLGDIRIFELPTGSEIESDFTNLTADQLAVKYPYFRGDGLKSVKSRGRIKSVGKNLFDGSKVTVNSVVSDVIGNVGASGVGNTASDFIKIKPSTQYILGGIPNASTYQKAFYDSNKVFISGDGTNTAFSTPSNARYVRVTVTASDLHTAQLELGSTPTPYESFRSSAKYVNATEDLRRVPSGVQDEQAQNASGVMERIGRCREYTLVAGDVSSVYTGFTNIDMVWVKKPIDYVGYNSASASGNNILSPSYKHKASAISDDSADIGYFNEGNALTSLAFGFAKGTTLAQAQTALAGTKIIYQLATPIITSIETSGTLLSYPSGSVYWENVTADVGIYSSGISIIATGFPISALEKLSKVDFTTGVETALDASTAVIASDGLSFAHPGLTNGDIVLYAYQFKQDAPEGNKTVDYYDSRYVIKDSITGKFFQWGISVANGTPTIGLTEV